jgi:hypothetical protein
MALAVRKVTSAAAAAQPKAYSNVTLANNLSILILIVALHAMV